MCGIAACITPNPTIRLCFINDCNALLLHRGPDDSGWFEDQSLVLVHRRLSILELSQAGHQPMESSSGRYVLVYNGEIYNHLELRKQFLTNHKFRGHSDSETIVELFDNLGPHMLSHLVGMWAIAIWDKKDQSLFLSRDRFGQKPLYWIKTNDGIFFSSEIKPLLRRLDSVSPNPTAMAEYLALGNYGHLGKQTFFHEVNSFPAGYYAMATEADLKINLHAYWKIPNVASKDKRSYGLEEREVLQSLVKEAVLSQTLSDVPIGMTLSGGIDSSVMAGILARFSTTPIQVFSASNKGNQYDEMPYARRVIEHWSNTGRLVPHEIEMESLAISKDLENGIFVQEEPFGDPSILSHLHIMKHVHQNGLKVILGGQGADELFFGYDSINHGLLSGFAREGKWSLLIKTARHLNISLTELARLVYGAILPERYKKSRMQSRIHRRFFLNPDALIKADKENVFLADPSNFYELWKESIEGVHLPHLVHYDDRNGMSFGIEGRMPFLDHRIIEFLAHLHPEEFIRGGVRKFLLKDSCREYLPSAIFDRQDKIGFFAPIHEMIVNDLDYVKSYFYGVVFPMNLVDNKVLLQDIKKYEEGKIDVISARRIWRVMSYVMWFKMFKLSI
ncbi:MAG: asparagine synthase (glutamine-hydrolyzing) [Saprospiraceae bacterium]